MNQKSQSSRRWLGPLLVSFILGALASCRCAGRSKSPETQADSLERRTKNQQPLVTLASAIDLTASLLRGEEGVTEDGYPSEYVDRAALRSLLASKQYARLNAAFESWQTAFEADPRKEYWVADAAEAFAVSDAALESAFEDWKQTTPTAFAPFLAAGTYWKEVGYARRGGRFVEQTHDDSMAAMNEAMEKSVRELNHALVLRPQLVEARRQKMMALMPTSRRDEWTKLAEQTHDMCSDCLLPHIEWILGLRPRWGGSYAQMQKVAALSKSSTNPRFSILNGYECRDRAQLLRNDQERQALEEASRAVSFGAHVPFLLERVNVLFDLQQFEEAFTDVHRALVLRPGVPEVHLASAKVLFAQKKYLEAAYAFREALRINPALTEAASMHKSIVEGAAYIGSQRAEAGELQLAIDAFDLAVELDPNNRAAKRNRTWLLSPLAAPSDADIAALNEQVNSSPDELRKVQSLAYALERTERYPEAIAVFDAYLLRHPSDRRARFERAVAHRRIGDNEEALKEAERACALGLSEACVMMREFR